MVEILKTINQFKKHLTTRNLGQDTIKSYCGYSRSFLQFLQQHLFWEPDQQIENYHFYGYYIALFLLEKEIPLKFTSLRSWSNFQGLKLPDYRPFRGTIPSLEELRALFSLSQNECQSELRNNLLLILLLCYGMSSSELKRISLKNIDFEQDQFTINLNNNLKFRTLPLIPVAKNHLQLFINNAKPDGRLLINKYGQPLSGAGLKHILDNMLAKAGLPNYCPQDLRRSWIKHLALYGSISSALYLSGFGPDLKTENYRQLLEKWHQILTDSNSLLWIMNSRRCPSPSSKGSGDGERSDSTCEHSYDYKDSA